MDDHSGGQAAGSQEVDDCRNALTFVGTYGQDDFGDINSPEREEKCQALPGGGQPPSARKLDAWDPVSPEFGHRRRAWSHLAQMPQQVVLCHSPVEADDPAICAPADQRLPADDLSMEQCQEAYENADRATMKQSSTPGRYARSSATFVYHARERHQAAADALSSGVSTRTRRTR